MAQGKMKQKVKLPIGAKQKKKHQKSKLGPKKGGRAIAPKKNRLVEQSKMNKTITKALNSDIERTIMLKAKNLEAKPMQIIKATEEPGTSKEDSSKKNKKA